MVVEIDDDRVVRERLLQRSMRSLQRGGANSRLQAMTATILAELSCAGMPSQARSTKLQCSWFRTSLLRYLSATEFRSTADEAA